MVEYVLRPMVAGKYPINVTATDGCYGNLVWNVYSVDDTWSGQSVADAARGPALGQSLHPCCHGWGA